jgi:glycosyltransferase involved in cell wall biosynthesis
MHVLHVTLGFYPANGWGGPVKVVYDNGRELVRRGHRVTVYCTNLRDKKNKIRPGTFEQEIGGMRIVYHDTWHLPWWPGTLGPFWQPDLAAHLKGEIADFDVVHLNGYRSLMTLQVARIARGAGIPLVVQPHGSLPIISNSLFLKRVYDWVLGSLELKSISALIAMEESERRQALGRGIPPGTIEVVPNGIDSRDRGQLPEPGSFRRRFGLDPDRRLILFLGRINKIKGTDMLIEAFARLGHLDAQLAIVGPDDGQLSEVRSLIQRYDLDLRVSLTGLATGSDVLAAYQDADLYVLPSRSDAFPVTIMEACLMGTPMVITDRCEIAYLVRDRIADVAPFDADAFAAAMERLLTDRERYDRYRANCQEMLAHNFSIEAVVNRLEAVYRRVIAERAK